MKSTLLESPSVEQIIFRDSPAAMAIFRGPDLIIEKLNPAFQANFADRPMLGQTLLTALPEIKDQAWYRSILNVFETGNPHHGFEEKIKIFNSKKDQIEERYFDYALILVEGEGALRGVYCQAIDSTARVQARQALERSQSRLNLALETGKIGFFERDLVNDTINFSDQMKRDWNVDLDKILTSAELNALIHPDDREQRQLAMNEAIALRKPYHNRHRVLRPDGKVIWMDARGTVTYNERGEPISVFGTSMDVTEIMEIGEQLLREKQRAEKASASKSAFLAKMSHEIRTPIGAIAGFSELLLENDLSQAEVRQFAEIISRSSKGLTRIIDDILDLSKVEAGHLRVANAKLELPRVLFETAEMMQESARAKNLKLSLDIDPEVPVLIVSDGVRLRQILTNLISNAIKFTERGSIQIRARAESRGHSHFKICVEVEDTGIGITPKQSEKLFRPFGQADQDTQFRYGGTGLGLSLSRELARLLGGDIDFENVATGGSCFCFHFFCHAVNSDKALRRLGAPPPVMENRNLKGLRVLLADDSTDNRFLVEQILAGAGAQVEAVENGREAVRQAKSKDYDLVLMDIEMPELDGNEATRELRSGGYQKPIVALSAHGMAEARTKSVEAGCDAYLTKPVGIHELVNLVYKVTHSVH